MNMVDLSAVSSPKSLLAFTTQFTIFLLRADCKALFNAGGRHVGLAKRTVSSLRATVPRALLASCKVSSSSKQNVSHET